MAPNPAERMLTEVAAATVGPAGGVRAARPRRTAAPPAVDQRPVSRRRPLRRWRPRRRVVAGARGRVDAHAHRARLAGRSADRAGDARPPPDRRRASGARGRAPPARSPGGSPSTSSRCVRPPSLARPDRERIGVLPTLPVAARPRRPGRPAGSSGSVPCSPEHSRTVRSDRRTATCWSTRWPGSLPDELPAIAAELEQVSPTRDGIRARLVAGRSRPHPARHARRTGLPGPPVVSPPVRERHGDRPVSDLDDVLRPHAEHAVRRTSWPRSPRSTTGQRPPSWRLSPWAVVTLPARRHRWRDGTVDHARSTSASGG